ncbi:hypothetical protein B0T18DRAFT_485135 [Schizothecium vesticola]|uniref:Uncharacterized protein n=1 Tax=Schizothecium vesticola TaxID=314040 RepID=A0AA40FBQ5_9PEZI|nr:hypothetical protein B0T18DRAFT_485135 [Schizothecium vesticola]
MASPELGVSAFDVLGFTDAELIEFMQQSRRPGDGGGFDLDIDGWDILAGDQKEKFAERLRFGARKALESTPSRPVDLDQVTARLLEVAAATTTTDTGRVYRPYAGEPTASPPSLQSEQELERQYHDMLVNDGGRPCYPIALLQAFSENPDEYPGLSQPWLRYGWEVFCLQLHHWHRFLQWQQLNRGSYNSDTEYVRYVNKTKLEWAFNKDPEAEELEDNPQDWHPLLHGDNSPSPPEGQPIFPTYVERVNCRLAQHGFTRTIQLKEDVKQQDKLSTWIEYLAYQYSWCDRYTRQLMRRQHRFDEEWERLVASGVLHDWETAEYLDTDASGFERQGDFDTAYRAVLDAEKAVAALWWK